MVTDLNPKLSRNWITLMLLLLPALALLIWTGTSPDPRRITPWVFTKDGWIIPAQSLVFIWIAATTLYALLSAIADLLFHPDKEAATLKPWLSITIILLLTLAARLAITLAWLNQWPPLIIADLAITSLLLLALRGSGRSPWWVILYALHPLPLLAGGIPHWLPLALIPLIFILAISHRFPRWLILAIAGIAAVAGIIAIIGLLPHPPFNSLAAELLNLLNAPSALLPIFAAFLEAAVLLIALRRNWPLPKIFAHLLLVVLICSPIAPAWAALPLVALAPIAWTRAGWVLSLTILPALAVIITPKFPTWLLMLEWMPVIVVEAQELLSETFSPTAQNSAPSAITTTPVT